MGFNQQYLTISNNKYILGVRGFCFHGSKIRVHLLATAQGMIGYSLWQPNATNSFGYLLVLTAYLDGIRQAINVINGD